MNERIFSFVPIVDARSRVLVLGTAPSVASLAQGFYYAHPRNAFWPILSKIAGREASSPEQRRALALEAGVALWDTIGSCERTGSLDSAIRNPQPNDIAALLRKFPDIQAVFCNGGTAWRLYQRHFGQSIALPALALPSTSPAYTLPFEQKYALWSEAFARLGVPVSG